ncbi:MAG: hypothetical protein CL535_18480 [Ahrensia sp.]|nr:hypothetical protein [Ahrensia sp.]
MIANQRSGHFAYTEFRAGLPLFLLLICSILIAVHFLHPSNPLTVNEGIGWNGWWDQRKYLESAAALANGDLSPDAHWYPIGYSLLAAPFVLLLPDDPFVFVNVIAFAIYGWAFFRLFQPIISTQYVILAFLIGLSVPVLLEQPFPQTLFFWRQFAVPWTTVPVAASYLFILYAVSKDVSDTGKFTDLFIGSAAALVVVTKPSDVLPLVPAGIAYFFRRIRSKNKWRIGFATAGAIAVLGPALGLTVAIHGGLNSPYVVSSGQIGLSFSQLPLRAYSMFLDSRTVWREESSLLILQPFLVVTIPLFLLWTFRYPSKSLLIAATCIISIVEYLAYNDFTPQNAVRFQLYHYWVWMLPIWTAGAVAGAASAIRAAEQSQSLLGKLAPILVAAAGSVFLASVRIETLELNNFSVSINEYSDGSYSYKLNSNSKKHVNLIDIFEASALDKNSLPNSNISLYLSGFPGYPFQDYRIISTQSGVRVIFNRPVFTESISFTLGDKIASLPTDPENVVPLTFQWRLSPFWRFRKQLG